MPPKPDPCAKEKRERDRAHRAADRAERARDRAYDHWSREQNAAFRERGGVAGCTMVDTGGDLIINSDCAMDHLAEAADHQAEADGAYEEFEDALEEWMDAEEAARDAAGEYCDCLEENEED